LKSRREGGERMNKKIVIAIVLVAIIAGAGLVAYILFPPSDEETGYLLRLNYNVGDKLGYSMDMTMKVENQSLEQKEYKFEMEILDFDGENYTIKQTIIVKEPWDSFTGTIKVNQTGHVIEYIDCSSEYLSMTFTVSDMALLGIILPSEKVELGKNWEVPIDIEFPEIEFTGMSISGTQKYTLSEVTNETIELEYETSFVVTAYATVTINANGTILLDAVTCNLVEITYFGTTKAEYEGQTYEGEVTLHGRLVT